MNGLNRRRVLRGMLNGGAVTVALPFLDCFLNGNGTALASGAPLPLRFGTWTWSLGMTSSVFVPKKTGPNFDLPEEIAALAPVQKHINLISNVTAFRDTFENLCHYTGWVVLTTGTAPRDTTDIPNETIDVTIGNRIGRSTRYRSLTATGSGEELSTHSYINAGTPNPPETSPMAFYTKLFGPEFQDPNAKDFKPDPRIMVRKSALSGVMNEIKDLNQYVGAEDKARLDQYFSGLRSLEQQFGRLLTKPEPIEACHVAGLEPKKDIPPGKETEVMQARHRLMTDMMVMAVACDQTRVFNMAYTTRRGDPSRSGYEKPHHTATHEEPVDEKLGYQPNVSWFTRRNMEAWAYFVDAFAKVKEGDGTVLDNVLIYATTDHGYARTHTLDRMPMFTAGRAGGRIKSGVHIDLGGDPGTRLGLTAMRAMGLEQESWGTKNNQTSKLIGEILT